MKKVFALIFLFVLVLVNVLMVHSPAVAQSDKPINLKFACWLPPMAVTVKDGVMPWMKEVEARTKGRVKFTYFGAGALGGVGEHYNLVLKGVADISYLGPSHHPGVFPLTQSIFLPMIFPSAEVTALVFGDMVEKYLKDRDFSSVKPLWGAFLHPSQLHMKTKPIKTLEDFKGMKICAAGTIMSKRVKLMGGVPIFIPFPEQYGAMQKGVIDGTVMSFMMMEAFKLYEVSKNVLAPPMGTGVYTIAMNKKKWNSLPPDIQNILDDMSKKYVMEIARAWDSACVRGEKLFLDEGGKIEELKGEELEKTFKMVQPMWQDWITEMEEKGLPGKKAVDDMYAILKDLGVDNPAIGYTPDH